VSERPYILITNDDGIQAPGLMALARALSEVADFTVVAPASEQSAVGHAITLSDPLRVSDYKGFSPQTAFMVDGTPADCVKIAIRSLLDREPDLVLSGINLGGNTGINTIYSGTVSAATEGSILGYTSLAVSLTTFTDPDFSYAARFTRALSLLVLEHGLPPGVFLNVNIPACSEEDVAGVMITRQGGALYREEFDRRHDPRGRVYYWLTGQEVEVEDDLAVDNGAVQKNYISITPLHFDLTRYDLQEELRSWNIHT